MPSDARDRILNAAEERLLAAGPGGLVLDAIAADAGVSKGGLLYHFGSKEALVAGLCERGDCLHPWRDCPGDGPGCQTQWDETSCGACGGKSGSTKSSR